MAVDPVAKLEAHVPDAVVAAGVFVPDVQVQLLADMDSYAGYGV